MKNENDISLFEVNFKNRVMSKFPRRPLTGRQGKWYYGNRLIIAHDESEIEPLISKELKTWRIRGKPQIQQYSLHREFEIINIRRIA